MTRPWKVSAVAMAVFGFVNGYVGTAAAPFCGSLGQCVQRVVDAGPPWFYPAALIPGVIAAAIFAAVVYILFLAVHGIRGAFRRPVAARMSRERPAEGPLRAEPLAARPSPEQTAAERRTGVAAVQVGRRRRAQPTPLLIAIGAGLVWAALSVGPTTLVRNLDQLIARDTVTTPFCGDGQPVREDGRCSSPLRYVPPGWCPGVGVQWECIGPAKPQIILTEPQCAGVGLLGTPPEADGKCHQRSGGTIEPLLGDVLRGAQSGLVGFLAVGAALLLWPRLRGSSARVDRGPSHGETSAGP